MNPSEGDFLYLSIPNTGSNELAIWCLQNPAAAAAGAQCLATLAELKRLDLSVVKSHVKNANFFDAFNALLDSEKCDPQIRYAMKRNVKPGMSLDDAAAEYLRLHPNEFEDSRESSAGFRSENADEKKERLLPVAFMKLLGIPATFIEAGELKRLDPNTQPRDGIYFLRMTEAGTGKPCYMATTENRSGQVRVHLSMAKELAAAPQ